MADSHVCITAWNQTTGKKKWSTETNAMMMPPGQLRPLASDGKHLFAALEIAAAYGFINESIICVDAATGKIVWDNASLAAPSYAFVADGQCNIALHIDNSTGASDKLYVIAHEAKQDEHDVVMGVEHDQNSGIWCLDAATGKVISRFDLPEAVQCNLLCDATTLYACAATSNEKPYTSTFAGYDVASGKKLWEKDLDGTYYSGLVKDGDHIVVMYSNVLSIWQTKTAAPTELWTHKLETRTAGGLYSDFAIDSTHLYLNGKDETVRALDIATGKEAWRQHFDVYYQRSNFDYPDKRESIEPHMNIVSTKNILYINDGGGMIDALDPASGKILWTRRFSRVEWNQTYIANQFVADYDNNSIAIIMSDGKVSIWK